MSSALSEPESKLRAWSRLVAITGLVGIALRHLVFAVMLYFIAPMDRLAGSLAGLLVGAVGVVYLLLLRAVIRRSRMGQLMGIVVCVAAAALGLLTIAGWSDWLVPLVNLIAAAALIACLPQRRKA